MEPNFSNAGKFLFFLLNRDFNLTFSNFEFDYYTITLNVFMPFLYLMTAPKLILTKNMKNLTMMRILQQINSKGIKTVEKVLIIGTRNWGGPVGISSNSRLIDDVYISVLMFGVYDETGQWIIEGVLVYPYIEVIDRPEELARGNDP